MRSKRTLLMVTRMEHDITNADPPNGSAAWARAFALLYDPFLWVGERTGIRPLRRELLGSARGRTIEIGCGTGLNLPHYSTAVDELVLLEPDAAMRRRLTKRVRRNGRRARVIDATAEYLPLADGSVDTVVSTLVLCTVDAPEAALQEIARVLRPDGQLLFIEHVRAASPRLARWQDRFEAPWRRFARGCRCNRATSDLLEPSGLAIERLDTAAWRAMPPIVRPLIAGRARKTGPTTSASSAASAVEYADV